MSSEAEKKTKVYEIRGKNALETYYIISSQRPTPDSLNKGHPVDFAFNPLLADFHYGTELHITDITKMDVTEITEPAKQLEVFAIAKNVLRKKRNMWMERLEKTTAETEKLDDFFLHDYLKLRK